MKKQEPKGFIDNLTVAKESLDYILQHQDYDWLRKYGNTYLNVAVDYIQKAIEQNPPFNPTPHE